MEIGIEASNVAEEKYFVNILGNRHAVNTVYACNDSDVKQWVHRIQKTYCQKLRRRKLIVALNADHTFNYANGRPFVGKIGKSLKEEPYQLVEICVENDVLLFSSFWRNKFPKVLKDLLNDNGVTVVGIGIRALAEKMEKDYGWIMTNKVVELRDLAAAQEPARDFSRFGVAKLARAVLGDDMDYVKPSKIDWRDIDLIKYATVDVFLPRLMGSTLLHFA